jgi:hypothetical protein
MMRWIVGSSLKFRYVVAAAAAGLMFFGVQQMRGMPGRLPRVRAPAGRDPDPRPWPVGDRGGVPDHGADGADPQRGPRARPDPLEVGRAALADRAHLRAWRGPPHRPAARRGAGRHRGVDAADVGRTAGDDPASLGDEPRHEDRDDVGRVLAHRHVDDGVLEGQGTAAPGPWRRQRPDLGRADQDAERQVDPEAPASTA